MEADGVGGVLNAAVAILFFTYLPSFADSLPILAVALVIAGALCSIIHALIAGLICSLFPTAVRQSGFAFPYSIGTAIFSGLTPLVMATLVRNNGLGAPVIQEVLGGAVALILAGTLRYLPLHLGTSEANANDGSSVTNI